MKHPHRYKFLSWTKRPFLETLCSEGEHHHFKIRNPRFDIGLVLLMAALFSLLGVLVAALCVLGLSETFSLDPLYITLVINCTLFVLAEFVSPIPHDAMGNVITDVQYSEKRDNLSKTPRFWIYFHYFLMRNHPMLSMGTFFKRCVIGVGILTAISLYCVPPMATLFGVLPMLILYIVIKIDYHSETM